jgi:hypothetical protein
MDIQKQGSAACTPLPVQSKIYTLLHPCLNPESNNVLGTNPCHCCRSSCHCCCCWHVLQVLENLQIAARLRLPHSNRTSSPCRSCGNLLQLCSCNGSSSSTFKALASSSSSSSSRTAAGGKRVHLRARSREVHAVVDEVLTLVALSNVQHQVNVETAAAAAAVRFSGCRM